ncbi:MAG: hypothetical protein M1833_002409 [Piccolia ochrophora]|nr:MAG: hypothetical protein M1833_002409 [Piccolia ochrophora]
MYLRLVIALAPILALRGHAAPTDSANSTVSAPPEEFTPQQGTNQNTEPLQDVPFRAFLSAPNPHKKPNEQPDADATCIYTYEPTLNSTTGVSFGLYDNLDSLRFEDIKQGGVGDCAFGASVLALIGSNRWEARIAGQYNLKTGVRNAYFDVEFVNTDGKAYVVQIDDTLPVTNDTTCHRYMGFQATLAANNQRVVYMPLLEKAWAKYLDAKPELKRSEPKKTGYQGLEGTGARDVLPALTGWPVRFAARGGPGRDATIAANTLLSIVLYQPTVLSSPNFESLKTLGSYWDEGSQLATLELGGITIINRKNNVLLYTRFSDASQHYIIAGHAYALTPDNDFRQGGILTTWQEAPTVLRNPWGKNPIGPNESGPPTLTLTIEEIAMIFIRITSVIPPSTENPRNP